MVGPLTGFMQKDTTSRVFIHGVTSELQFQQPQSADMGVLNSYAQKIATVQRLSTWCGTLSLLLMTEMQSDISYVCKS